MIYTTESIHSCPEYVRPSDWWKDENFHYAENQHIKTSRESIDSTFNILRDEFNQRAERWENETAIHSSPGETYLHRDYFAIVGLGILNPEIIIPLILARVPNTGSDWFFALETIAECNPAKDCADFDCAYNSWLEWVQNNLNVAR